MDTPADQHIPGRRYRSVSSPPALQYSSSDTPVVQPVSGLLTPPPEQQYSSDRQRTSRRYPIGTAIQTWETISTTGGRQQLPQTPPQQFQPQYPTYPIRDTIQYWEDVTNDGRRTPPPVPLPGRPAPVNSPMVFVDVPELAPMVPVTQPHRPSQRVDSPDIQVLESGGSSSNTNSSSSRRRSSESSDSSPAAPLTGPELGRSAMADLRADKAQAHNRYMQLLASMRQTAGVGDDRSDTGDESSEQDESDGSDSDGSESDGSAIGVQRRRVRSSSSSSGDSERSLEHRSGPDIHELLNRAYEELPVDPIYNNSSSSVSGELRIHSGADDGQERLRQYAASLRRRGLDIDLDDELGEGGFGTVYRGRYNEQIANIEGRAQRRLSDIIPGQWFAAKFAHWSIEGNVSTPLTHEVEKCILKTLVHPYIVSYRLAVNLGRRRVLRRKVAIDYADSDEEEEVGHHFQAGGQDITSYDGLVLVMELADRGSLKDFLENNLITVRLAVRFIKQLGDGLSYMRDMGVAHRDIYTANILVFSGAVAGEYTAKWTDFGFAVSRDVYRQWGIDIPVERMEAMMRSDIKDGFAVVFADLMNECTDEENLDPGLRQLLEALLAALRQPTEPLRDILDRHILPEF